MDVSASRSGSWDLDALEADWRAAQRDVGRRLAAVIKREHNSAARALGATRLRGMGDGGVRLGVSCKVSTGATAVAVDVAATPAGPWSILESGRRGGYTVRPRRREAITTPDGPRTSATIKRGTAGRRAWSRTADMAEPAILTELEAVYDDALGV